MKMIRAKKILTLKPRVQVRKCGGVFHLLHEGEKCEETEEIFGILLSHLSSEEKGKALYFYERERWEDIYYLTLDHLGEAKADWDMMDDEGEIDFSGRTVFSHQLYLDSIRSPYNLGSIFRNAEAFGVERMILRPGTASPLHDRAERTSRGTVKAIPWEFAELEEIPEDMPVFALELGGKDVTGFDFPEKGICIIGSEESGVSAEALKRADASLGRVSIRQYGAKGSINVASATAVLLQYWANSSDCSGRDA